MLTALASLSLLLAAVPDTPLPAVHVQVADLDLHSAAGRAELDKRLASAVTTVCPAAQSIADPREVQQARACRTATRAVVDQQRQTLLASAGVPLQIASSGY